MKCNRLPEAHEPNANLVLVVKRSIEIVDPFHQSLVELAGVVALRVGDQRILIDMDSWHSRHHRTRNIRNLLL